MAKSLRAAAIAGLVASLLIPSGPNPQAKPGLKTARLGPPGQWTAFSDPTMSSILEIALQRTQDGVLHMVWSQENAADSAHSDLMHVGVDPQGNVMASNPVTVDWAGFSDPSMVLLPDGSLRAFWGGIRGTQSPEPNQNLNTATAPQSGSPWDLFLGTVATGDAAYASDTGAAIIADGTTFQTWAGTGEVYVHRGLDPATPNYTFSETPAPGDAGLNSELAVDGSTGQLWVGWWYTPFSSSPPPQVPGVYVQEVDRATGGEAGTSLKMPGTTTTYNGREESSNTLARLPMTGRSQGHDGVYVAYIGGYPTENRILLWRIGDPDSLVLDRTENVNNPAIAAAPDGSLWVVWEQPNEVIAARHSNADLTQWSPKITIKPPTGTEALWKLAADAGPDGVDVVATVNLSVTDPGVTAFHTRIATPIGGTDGADTLSGTPGNDVMFGGGGPDNLDEGAGNDKLDGGPGNDKLEGGPGKDVLNGGPGKDRCVISESERKKAKSCEIKVIKRNNM